LSRVNILVERFLISTHERRGGTGEGHSALQRFSMKIREMAFSHTKIKEEEIWGKWPPSKGARVNRRKEGCGKRQASKHYLIKLAEKTTSLGGEGAPPQSYKQRTPNLQGINTKGRDTTLLLLSLTGLSHRSWTPWAEGPSTPEKSQKGRKKRVQIGPAP